MCLTPIQKKQSATECQPEGQYSVFRIPDTQLEAARQAGLPVIRQVARRSLPADKTAEVWTATGGLSVVSICRGRLAMESAGLNGILQERQMGVCLPSEAPFRLRACADCTCLLLELVHIQPDPVFVSRLQAGKVFLPRGAAAASAMVHLLETESSTPSMEENTAMAYQFLMYLRQHGVCYENEKTCPPLVAAALGMIDEELTHLEGVDEIAARLEVSLNHLIRQFTRYMGISPGKYLRQRRIAYAKVLLTRPDMSVALVSGLSGFSDPNYFAKVFRQMTGVSPSEYAAAHENSKIPQKSNRLEEIYL